MNSIIKLIALLALISIMLIAHFYFDVGMYFSMEQIESWLVASGPLAPVLYVALMALAIIISPIPSLPLDIVAGAFFGPWLGTLYSLTGALIGACISFLMARHLGQAFIERVLKSDIDFCVKCSNTVLTKVVFISRLIPVVSFDVVSYGAGLTRMSLRRFALATFFGMIPLTFIYNYFGSVLVINRGYAIAGGLVMVALFLLIPVWARKIG
jgi:uncharacterized membrane protein YdjX (TVP38/TMEM64 family)